MNKRNCAILILLLIFITTSSWNNTPGNRFLPGLQPLHTEQEKWRVPVIFDNMKLLYAGINNPVTIYFPGSSDAATVGMEEGTVASDNNYGEERHYILKPLKIGPQDVTIKAGGKSYRITVSVRRLPNPDLSVEGISPGKITAATFKQKRSISTRLTDTRFAATYDVISYTVGANGGSFGAYREAANDGAEWKGAAAQIINKAGPGTSVFFNDIRVKGPDGILRNLGTIAFQLL
jgi:hypothetical protein